MKIEDVEAQSDNTRRKPRIVIAGEFSAGKSCLINGLLGKEVLPTNVTSTSMPPVWLSSDGDGSIVVDLEGNVQGIEAMEDVEIADTLYCRLVTDSPILDYFDLIDTPGNSDPQIPAVCWERMIEYADAIVWCTGATQAWRQSEKAVCRDFPVEVLEKSTLLITQADRLPDEKAARKVLRRVERDASKLFPNVLMASLVVPEDVERIADHLILVSEQIVAMQGCVQGDAVETTDELGQGEAQESLEHTEDFEVTEPMPAVTLSRMKWKGQAPPRPSFDNVTASGPAEQLWRELTEGKDMDDAAIVLSCAQDLIKRLDADTNDDKKPNEQSDNSQVALAG